MGIGNTVSLDDPRIVTFIHESTETLVKEIECINADGTITKQEFIDFYIVRDFVKVVLNKHNIHSLIIK